MAKNVNKKIDEILKEERRKRFPEIIGLAIGAIFMFVFVFQPYFAQDEVKGTVTRLFGAPSDEGEILYLIVKLESGEEVKSKIMNTSQFRKGERVVLLTYKPLLFGRQKYVFEGYE